MSNGEGLNQRAQGAIMSQGKWKSLAGTAAGMGLTVAAALSQMFSQSGCSQSRSLPPVLEPPAGILVGFPNSTQTLELLTNFQDVNSDRKCEKVASKEGTAALKACLVEARSELDRVVSSGSALKPQ